MSTHLVNLATFLSERLEKKMTPILEDVLERADVLRRHLGEDTPNDGGWQGDAYRALDMVGQRVDMVLDSIDELPQAMTRVTTATRGPDDAFDMIYQEMILDRADKLASASAEVSHIMTDASDPALEELAVSLYRATALARIEAIAAKMN